MTRRQEEQFLYWVGLLSAILGIFIIYYVYYPVVKMAWDYNDKTEYRAVPRDVMHDCKPPVNIEGK